MKNFNDIYKEIYETGIEELTKLKKETYKYLIIFLIALAFLFIMFFTVREANFLMGVLVFANIIALFLLFRAESNYRKAFKELVIKKIIYLYNPDFSFAPNMGVSKSEYLESFFDRRFDRFSSEDLIYGKINNKYNFKMSEVKTELEEVERDSKGNTHVETHTLFYGLYGIVDIEDSINHKMDITSNNFLNKYHKNRIEVDSGEFEKKYDMFSTDRVRTMEIFTSDMIEKFNKFQEDTGYVMQIRVVPNRLYFRISCGEAFEAPTFKSALSYEYLYKNYRMIDFPISIVTKMIENSLETRK